MKNGSAKSLYQWINDIKWAHKSIQNVKEKIIYYESQLGNCRSNVYDSIGTTSSVRNTEEDNLLLILEKIEENKKIVSDYEQQIKEYNIILEKLGSRDKEVLRFLVESNYSKVRIAEITLLSRSSLYKRIERIKVAYLTIIN